MTRGRNHTVFCTGLDLPKLSSGKMWQSSQTFLYSVTIIGESLDEVKLKNDWVGEISLCGHKQNCKNLESIIGSVPDLFHKYIVNVVMGVVMTLQIG